MSRFKKLHQECPCRNSSDAFCIREDDSGFCFSCHQNFSSGGNKIDLEEDDEDVKVEKVYKGWRGISTRTMKFYGIQFKVVNEVDKEVFYPYGDEAAKIEKLDVKGSGRYSCLGSFKDAGLFGADRFDPGSKESITIFEGEKDAPSGYEMLRGNSACVSLKSGAGSAVSDLRKFYEYVNSFSKIYLCFDNDEPGRNALAAVAGLFDFRKTYHVKLTKRKDANEYLQAGEIDDFERTWIGAKRFAPDNIISAFSDISRALDESREDCLATYPFPELTSRLYGLHAGEIVVIKAPEGVGKTEFLRALESHVLKETEHPIGVIHLEEDNATTIKAIAGYHLELPAVLPDCGLSKQDILDGYRKAVKDDEGRVHIHSSFNVEDEEAFLGNLRFLGSALGCRIIFFDHISWLGTGLADEDERKKLDRISQRIKLLAKELRICVVEISHVNDDGKTRGSRNISKVANTVISLDRDILTGSNQVDFLVEKARLGGRTGPAGHGYFDEAKGKLMAEPPVVTLPEES